MYLCAYIYACMYLTEFLWHFRGEQVLLYKTNTTVTVINNDFGDCICFPLPIIIYCADVLLFTADRSTVGSAALRTSGSTTPLSKSLWKISAT